jgi:hypothetical protein
MRALVTFCIIALTAIASATQPSDTLDALHIHIDAHSGVTREAVVGILHAREAKDPAEIWDVDRHRGDIRIRKHRSDHVPLAPGTAIEFWHQDSSGRWISRPTA